jgi:hypothetical protein
MKHSPLFTVVLGIFAISWGCYGMYTGELQLRWGIEFSGPVARVYSFVIMLMGLLVLYFGISKW